MQPLVTFATGLLGAVVGTAVVFAVSARRTARAEPAPSAPGVTTVVVQQVAAPAWEGDRGSAAAAPSSANAPPGASAADPERPSPEEARARVEDAHAAALVRHRNEPRSSWGNRAEEQFRSDLSALGTKASFEVLDVDCRTATCTAALQFESRAAANKGWMKVATNRYANACASEVLVDDPSKKAAGSGARASVLFDCSKSAQAAR
jgi:hypothetical protein